MKSIKCAALLFIIGAANMHAMNNNNNNNGQIIGHKRSAESLDNHTSPFAQLSSRLHKQLTNQLETAQKELAEDVDDRYCNDMHQIVRSFEYTHQDDTTNYPKAFCYKVGPNAYLVSQKSDLQWNYTDDPTDEQQRAMNAASEQGNRIQKVDETPMMRGDLAHVLFIRAIIELRHSDASSTPDDVRKKIINEYITISKNTRRCDNVPVSDEILNKELQALRNIQFTCTRECIPQLIKDKKMPGATSDTITDITNYLLRESCTDYRKIMLKNIIDRLAKNYTATFYRGV